MGRPRYHINNRDWLDCLDWLEHQCSKADWYLLAQHPVQNYGIPALKEQVRQWRLITRPSEAELESAQALLLDVLLTEDWARLRKALSARKRRRKESLLNAKPVNITLTPAAHALLAEYRHLVDSKTLSSALELGLHSAMASARREKEKSLDTSIKAQLAPMEPKEIVAIAQRYLATTEQRKTLANSSRFAFEVFNRRRDGGSFKLLRERFVEDLVWNNLHLNIDFKQLDIWDVPEDRNKNNS